MWWTRGEQQDRRAPRPRQEPTHVVERPAHGASRLVEPSRMRWRVGRKVERTVYAQLADEPSDRDPIIGLMDSRLIARAAVEGHNRRMGFTP